MMIRRAATQGRPSGGVPRCDVCCRLAPADVDADTRTLEQFGAGNLTLGAYRSNEIERGRLKGASTKISSSNLENPGAMCLPSQISRRGAAPAGGEAHGRRWVWRRRGARSARRPRLRPRCELISNPRDRRAHRQTLMEFARPRAHFFHHIPPPHHESDRSRPSTTRRPPSPRSLRPRERRRPHPRLLSTTRTW